MGKENPGFGKELMEMYGYFDEFGVARSERSWGPKDVGVNKGRLMRVEKLRRERKGGFLGLFSLLRIE